MRSMQLPAVLGILLIVYEGIPMRIPRELQRPCQHRFHPPQSGNRRLARTLPPGSVDLGIVPIEAPDNWDAYCRLLKYIRERTGPKTIVAVVLKNFPFPSTNGATGRRSPFRVESGVAWMSVVAEDLDETFAGELERLGCDSIVVWSPAESDERPMLPLKRLTSVIVDRYEPEARFGRFEVWRRKCAAPKDARRPAGPTTGGDVRSGSEGHPHQSGSN